MCCAPRLRPARADESEWCFALHESAMRPYVEARWGWDERTQRRLHDEWFDPDRLQIIERDGTPVGVLDVRPADDHVYLARIEVVPLAQGTGVGSAVVRELQQDERPVLLHVFTINVRARALYERLGFVTTHEGDGRVAMESRPRLR